MSETFFVFEKFVVEIVNYNALQASAIRQLFFILSFFFILYGNLFIIYLCVRIIRDVSLEKYTYLVGSTLCEKSRENPLV